MDEARVTLNSSVMLLTIFFSLEAIGNRTEEQGCKFGLPQLHRHVSTDCMNPVAFA